MRGVSMCRLDLYSTSPVDSLPSVLDALGRVNKSVFSRHLKAASMAFGSWTGSGTLFQRHNQWKTSSYVSK